MPNHSDESIVTLGFLSTEEYDRKGVFQYMSIECKFSDTVGRIQRDYVNQIVLVHLHQWLRKSPSLISSCQYCGFQNKYQKENFPLAANRSLSD
jgi:hypothetical protein